MEKKLTKKITKKVREAYAIMGSLGGKASFKKKGKKGMSELGKKGAKARWAVDKKATKNSTKRRIK